MPDVKLNITAETALADFRNQLLSTLSLIDRSDVSDSDHTLLVWRDLHEDLKRLKTLADRIGDAGLQMRDAEKRSNSSL